MIPIESIDHINLTVRDVDRSADFYTGVFGLAIREDRRDADRPYVIVGRPGVGTGGSIGTGQPVDSR